MSATSASSLGNTRVRMRVAHPKYAREKRYVTSRKKCITRATRSAHKRQPLMHSISAPRIRSRPLEEMHFHSRRSSRLCCETREHARANGRCSSIRSARLGKVDGRSEGGMIYLSRTRRSHPRVLVPPVEHPDGKRSRQRPRACRELLIGDVYIIFSERAARAWRVAGGKLNVYSPRSNTLFPKAHHGGFPKARRFTVRRRFTAARFCSGAHHGIGGGGGGDTGEAPFDVSTTFLVTRTCARCFRS